MATFCIDHFGPHGGSKNIARNARPFATVGDSGCVDCFAQKRDMYIGDFVAALLYCKRQLFTFYLDIDTAFRRDKFYAFNQILGCNHE